MSQKLVIVVVAVAITVVLFMFNYDQKPSFKLLEEFYFKDLNKLVSFYGEPVFQREYFATQESREKYNERAILFLPDGFRKEIDKIKECLWELEDTYVSACFFKYNDTWILYYGYEWKKTVLLAP